MVKRTETTRNKLLYHWFQKLWKSTYILLATGYEQARSVVAYMTGDKESAARVELKLPETGVCKVALKPKFEKTSCCIDE